MNFLIHKGSKRLVYSYIIHMIWKIMWHRLFDEKFFYGFFHF